MLYQTDLYLEKADYSAIQSELAVKIHGALMHKIPEQMAMQLHKRQLHPFSLFCVPYEDGQIVRISALTDDASVICECASYVKSIMLFGMERDVKIVSYRSSNPININECAELIDCAHIRINIVTPAMVKLHGKPTARPELQLYFGSVADKLKEFEHIDISKKDIADAFGSADISEYDLYSSDYNVSGHHFPGMCGRLCIDHNNSDIIRILTAYACYSGIGGKTGQGMGGFIVEPSE